MEAVLNEILSSQLRAEVIELISKGRTKSQLLFCLDYYLDKNQLDAAEFYYEMLKRSNINEDILETIYEKIRKHKQVTKKEGTKNV